MLNYESLLANAMQLPVADRLQLIDALWDTVPEESLPPLSEAWREEIAQRTVEFDGGTVTTVPWQEIRDAALDRLDRKRQ